MTNSLPTGNVTFLFTDIEGSTRLWENHPEAMKSSHARHNQIVREAVESNRGYVFQVIGDSFCAAFQQAEDAVRASAVSQTALQTEDWGEAVIKVRMGIHTGVADIQENGLYQGYLSLSRVQRLMSVGHGGQVLVSRSAREGAQGLANGVTLRDMGEKRLKDLSHPEHIYQLVIPNLATEFPPLKTLDAYRHNLPAQTTTFIGRDNEIAEVKNFIAEHRIVTLTGSGGAGKTRLSLQAGAECLDPFFGGVWFVELAALTEPALIPSAILSALGLREKESDIQFLANAIGNQPALLILDNCEHLIEDCARLVERLTQACPKLHVLASSREAFDIAGEHPYRVPSLRIPDPKHSLSLDEIVKCESVQLFIERVKTYVPSFSLTEKNASAVAQVCSRLDGIPLALELAAARVKVMSVEQMAARLGDVFNLLTSGSRTALPRQQTLRALIEWSYDLLSDSEKSLFRKLSAFSGGWSLEAAETVCGGERGEAILDDLARLVDKSLVNKEEIDGEARFHMLETIRQYAQFKLFASEEVEEVKNRHRDWYMELAETVEPKLRTGEQQVWLDRLEMEHDNLRAAMKWCIEQMQVEQALRIPSALEYFWDIHGHYEEGINWLTQALKMDEANAKRNYPLAWANAIHARLALSSAITGSLTHFQPEMDEAVKIYREYGEDFRLGHALYHMAYIPHFAGDVEKAKATYEESLAVFERINDLWGRGGCIHCLAHLVEQEGNTAQARKLYDESLELIKTAGDHWSMHHPKGDAGRIFLNEGRLDAAFQVYEESLKTFEELGSLGWIAATLRQMARIFRLRGDFALAREHAEKSLSTAVSVNDSFEIMWSHVMLGTIHWSSGEFEKANQNILTALKTVSDRRFTGDLPYLKVLSGIMECYTGQAASGRERIMGEFEGIRNGVHADLYDLLPWFALSFWLEKDIPRAKQTYLEALEGVNKMRWFIRIPECLEGLGKIAVAEKDYERAARLFGASAAMREKMGTPIPPALRGDYDSHVRTLREKFTSSVEEAWSVGGKMPREEAVTFALDE
jgi:predicted ATPase/class 3 adenylate cyclase